MMDPTTDTVDVLHPSGQIITMPTSVAQQVGVTPDMIVPRDQPQQVSASEYGLNNTAINSIPTAGPAPAPQPQPAAPPTTSTMGPRGRNNLGVNGGTGVDQEIASPQGVVTPAPDNTNPSPPGPSAPQPITTADLRNGGEAAIYNDHTKAAAEGDTAGKQVADAHSQFFDAMGKAYADRNAANDQIAQRKADDDAKQLAAINLKNSQIDSAITALGNQKIDRSVDHPIMAAISAVIGMFGQAATGAQSNAALDTMFKMIDRKTQAQMQDRQNAIAQVGLQRDQVAGLRQHLTDQNAMYDGLMAANTQKAINIGDTLMARSNSSEAQANWQVQKAAMQDKLADYKSNAMDKQNAKDNTDRAFTEQQKEHRDTLGVQYAGIKQQQKSLDEQKREHDLARQDKLDELQLGYARLGQKELADKAKEAKTLGIGDPRTGDIILQPEGQKIADQASAMETAARKAPPAQQAQLLAQAKNLRDQAQVVGGWVARDPKEAEEVTDQVINAQQMIDIASKLKAKLAEDPGMTDRKAWASLGTDFNQAKVKYIELNKAKPSSREMEAISEVFGDDPAESMKNRALEPGKLGARIDSMLNTTVSDTRDYMKGHRYRGDWKPQSPDAQVPPKLQGATSVERAADAPLGVLGQSLSFTSNDRRSLNAENTGPSTPTGLSPQDTSVVQQLAKKYDKASDTDRDTIKSQLQAYASIPRPGVSNAVVTLINAENPALYKEIVASAPNAARVAGDGTPLQATTDRIAQQQVMRSSPIADLAQAALAGDSQSKMEIVRRAASGDKQAMAAAAEIIKAKK